MTHTRPLRMLLPAIAVCTALLPFAATATAAAAKRTISLSASGTVRGTPDMASISTGVASEGGKGRALAEGMMQMANGNKSFLGMTRTLAKEWGRFNVTVNCVAFGPIETRLTQTYDDEPPTIDVGGRAFKVGLSAGQTEHMLATVPLGRVGQPEDAAGAVYLFCIPESDFVSGQLLICSGGLRS